MSNSENCEALKLLTTRVFVLEESHEHIKAELSQNTTMTKAIKTDTAALVDFAQAYQATTLVGKALGRFMVWLSLIAGGIAAVWAAWKTGR